MKTDPESHRRQSKSEIRRQTVLDLPPRVAVVAAAWNRRGACPQEQRLFLFRMPNDLMNALAEFGILVGQKIRLDAGVGRGPSRAASLRLVNAGGRDRDL